MFTYALKKLFTAIPLVIGVITLIFVLVEASPGDATARPSGHGGRAADDHRQVRLLHLVDVHQHRAGLGPGPGPSARAALLGPTEQRSQCF